MGDDGRNRRSNSGKFSLSDVVDGTARMTYQNDLLGACCTRIEPSGHIRDRRTLADEVSISDLPPTDTGGRRGMQ
jgi:hypothetical protein